MSKRFLLIIAICVLALIGVFALSKPKSDTPSTTNSSVGPSNHVTGKGNKKVTLVEYGDFQCPVCLGFYPTVKQVKAQFADDIYFQFRNLPLFQIHKNAFAASRAAASCLLIAFERPNETLNIFKPRFGSLMFALEKWWKFNPDFNFKFDEMSYWRPK